jgi:predicted DNA-binding antitoxin AbrB/MazE fold protein
METELQDLEMKEGRTVRLKINCGKTKSLRINARTDKAFELDKKEIEEVDKFTYFEV